MIKNIKQIVVGLVVIVLLLSIGINGLQKKRLVNYTERVTTIENTNTQLLTNIENKDLKLALSDTEILTLKDRNAELEAKNRLLEAREAVLETSLAIISPSVENIPPDSSYAFITSVYDYEGELKYPINEKQVKAIHITYLEKLTLRDLTVNLQAQVSNLSFQLKFSDAIQRKLLEQVEILKSEKEDYKEIISNKDEKIVLQEKQVKKEKRKTVFYKITTITAGGLIILIAL